MQVYGSKSGQRGAGTLVEDSDESGGRYVQLRKIGPRGIFLITIRNRFQQPAHVRFRSAYSALPQFENAPPLLQQFIAVSDIPFHVLVKFQAPELFARFGDGGVSAVGMPMPKAAMNENADPMARQHHIWPPWKIFSV